MPSNQAVSYNYAKGKTKISGRSDVKEMNSYE